MSAPVWKGHLTFGNLAIAARLFSGPSASTPGLKQIHRECGEPAGQQIYCKVGHGAIRPDAVAKAAEFDGRLIPIPAAELDAIAPMRLDRLPLVFVSSQAVDPIYYESTYYLAPDGLDEPKYAALYEFLRDERGHAVAKIVLQRERYLILRPGATGIIAHTLYFGIEARALNQFRTQPATMEDRRAVFSAATGLHVSFDPSETLDEYPAKLHQMVKRLANPAPEEPAKKPSARARRVRPAA